jgi:hypothetical protein
VVIEIDEKTVGLWSLTTAAKTDFLAVICEIEPDKKYKLTYRFRYHKDDGVFESKDEKHWYEGTLSGTRSYVVLTFRNIAKEMAMVAGEPLYEVMMDERGPDDFTRRLQDLPGAYARYQPARRAQG